MNIFSGTIVLYRGSLLNTYLFVLIVDNLTKNIRDEERHIVICINIALIDNIRVKIKAGWSNNGIFQEYDTIATTKLKDKLHKTIPRPAML